VDNLEQQVRVSKMLGMAFVLSITGIFGVGSLIALVLGCKALRIIRSTDQKISGRLLAWWCILAGALGTLILPPLTVLTIVKQLR
jgi:apolipoprotein N-acyltransferase